MSNDNIEQTEKEKQSRRPRLNFSEMGVPKGAELVYKGESQHKGKESTAIVLSDTTVLFEGEEEYLTNVISKITNKEHNHNPTHNWYYQGKHLHDIYNEIYGEKLDFKTALARFKSEMNQKYLLTKKGKQFLIDVNNDKIEAIPTSTKKPIPVTDEQILGYLQDKDMSKQHLSYAPAIATYIKTHYLTNNTQGEPQMNNTLASKLATLLTKTHNLILHGAPGTGKTHLAREIAEAMGCSENEVGFVQFHPSYDYTDFVEGLRPVNNGDGQIGFERKNGVFKAFCAKGVENYLDSKTPFVFIIDEINREDMSKIFGELFFAIEPGYRGAEKCNSLRTQYANLQSEPNAFDEVLKITDSDNFGHFSSPKMCTSSAQ